MLSLLVRNHRKNKIMSGYFEKAKAWATVFTSLRDKMIGYKRANVTLCIHAMEYPIPMSLAKSKTVKLFTG